MARFTGCKAISGIALTILCVPALAQAPPNATIERGTLPQRWPGQAARCMEIPEWQVHEYNANLFILRQSPCSNYEKPFIFIFFGKQRALLLDTGAADGNLGPTLQRTIKLWLERNERRSIALLVVHTHPHGDHVAGDAQLEALRDPAMPVTFVPAELEATKRFYGIAKWPEEIGQVDLGGRVLDMIPIPGHSAVSVALYDRKTAILFSGDSLYPGRLYVADLAAFQASTERLIRFTADKPVAHILGNHIEQTTTPFLDYPVGTIHQPEEHELPLSRGSLLELEDGLLSMRGTPRRLALRDFTIWPVGGDWSTPEEAARVKAYIEEQRRMRWTEPVKR